MKRMTSILALTALAMAGCSRTVRPPAPAVPRGLSTAVVVERSVAAPVEVEGTVVGTQESVVASRLFAPVLEVRVVPGQRVRAGQLLLRLEQREADGALEGAQAGLDAAQAAHAIAARNRDRYQGLAARGAVAQIELERAVQDEAASRAQVAAAQAALRRAEMDRSQAVITSPFDAIVVEKMVAAGDLAVPGRPLVRLASATGRRVEAAPSEEQAARLNAGDPVSVVLSTGTFDGRVSEVVGAVDPTTRRRIVRIDLPPGAEPAVGSFARVLLPGLSRARLLVPARAVVERGGLVLSWTVGPDERLALRYVRLGAPEKDGLVEVRSGLESGERVVLDPPADLAAGSRVRS